MILDEQTALIKTVTGFCLYLDPRDVSMAPRLLLGGEWEQHVTVALRSLVRVGDQCVNVGANVGYHALWLARLAGPTGAVMAVEPSEHLCTLLRRNVRANGLGAVQIRQCAAGRAEGSAELVVPHVENGGLMCEVHDYGCARVVTDGDGPQVSVYTLDQIVLGQSVDVLLIDAEGSEFDVLAGATQCLDRSPLLRMVIEFDPADHDNPEELLAGLVASGFVLGHVDGAGAIVGSTIGELCAGGQLHLVARRD